MYVFYPSLMRPLAIQEALARKCPGLDITVFGRLTELQAMAEREPPQAILAQNAVLGQFPGYQPKLQGIRSGATTENYVLLSLDKPFKMETVPVSAIGAVGMLDRKELEAFVEALVGGTPRINRVTKVEDLLPLLIFRSVSAVLVSEANMLEFRKKSRANLVGVRLEKSKVGLMAVGMRDSGSGSGASAAPADGEKKVLASMKALDQGTLALLGVEAWK